MLFDTHAHLDDEKFDADREDIIAYIKKEGVSLLVNIGADMEGSKKSAPIILPRHLSAYFSGLSIISVETEISSSNSLTLKSRILIRFLIFIA